MLWSPAMVVREWHPGTATDVCSAWIWTSARHASSVSSYSPLNHLDSHIKEKRNRIRANPNNMFVFFNRRCQARGPWGWPRDGQHGICLWPLPGTHCRQQDQLQCLWRLWSVLRLLPCKEISRQVTFFSFYHILLKLSEPSWDLPLFFIKFLYLATCPLIGSLCTPWWPYASATVTAWSSPTSTTTRGYCLLLWPSTRQSWAVKSRWRENLWKAAPWSMHQACRHVAPSSSLIACSRDRPAKVTRIFIFKLIFLFWGFLLRQEMNISLMFVG